MCFVLPITIHKAFFFPRLQTDKILNPQPVILLVQTEKKY